jgi:hypothetical protein
MAITVIISRDDNGAPMTREVYDTGEKYTVEGGDLTIVGNNSGRPQLLAMYGSGNWMSVHVDDFVRVVTEKPAEEEEEDASDAFSFDTDTDTDTETAVDDDSGSELDALLADS